MNFALVGAFVLVLASALVAGVLWLASGGLWQTSYDVFLAVEDESVAGLNLDAPVKYNGVDVGKVQAIHLDHTNPQRVSLLFAIERGTPIKEDTVAILRTQGLTGIAYVELIGGTAASPLLRAKDGARYPQIKTTASLAARLENVLTRVLAKLDSTSSNIDALLSKDNLAAFHSILLDAAIVTHTVAGRQQSIDAGLLDAATTLKRTAAASAKLGPLMERISSGADSVDTMGMNVSQTSIKTGLAVDAMGTGVKRMGTQTLPELERLLAELSTLSTSLRALTEQTRRDPRGLLFGRTPVPDGPGETSQAGDKP